MGVEDLDEGDLWEALYSTIPPLLADGEKTIGMIASENGLDWKTAKKKIREWLAAGKIEEVGIRRIPKGPESTAYRVVVK